MVYVANTRLWLRSMSDANARPIPGTEITQGVLNPVFSPDGRSLAFWSAADLTLKRIAVSGGAPVTLGPASSPLGMSWGTDGIVFGQDPGGIMRVSPNGGKPEQLVGVKNGELADGPQMLAGGQLLLFTIATGTNSDRWDKAQIVVQSLTSGERKTLIEAGSDARYLPTGHIVYVLGGVLYAVPFDLKRLQVTAGPVPILEGIRRAGAQQTGVAHFSVANGGSLMFIPGPVSVAGGQSDLALFDGKGGTETLKLPPGSYTSPRISPDGKYVAFGNDDGKEVSVWIYELSGASSMRRLTFGGNNRYPIWSPDGQRVAFNSDREGDGAIFWQKADGTDTAERLTRAEQGTNQVPKSWSPDGKQFLFEAVKGSSVSLWTFSLQDRKSTLIPGVQSTGPLNSMFSPDGRWIAYQSNQTGASQVYVQPFPSTGAKYQITKNGGFTSVWSPDGKHLFYLPGTGGQFVVVSITTQPSFTFGNPQPLSRGWLEGGLGYPRVYDILPDGKRFIAVVPAGETPSGAAAAPQINVVLNWFEDVKQRVPIK